MNDLHMLASSELDVLTGKLSYSLRVWIGGNLVTDEEIDLETYTRLVQLTQSRMGHVESVIAPRKPGRRSRVQETPQVTKSPPMAEKKPAATLKTIEEALGLGKRRQHESPEATEAEDAYGQGSPFEAGELS
jgi:hypothetical protein